MVYYSLIRPLFTVFIGVKKVEDMEMLTMKGMQPQDNIAS